MTQIAGISIYSHDLAAARRFYVDTLGFTLEESMGDYGFKLTHEGVALVVLAGGRLCDPVYPSGVVLGIPTPDADAASRRLAASGVRMVVSRPEPFPVGRFIAVADPSGNVIELLELSARDS